jgi:hypothetical protein
MMKRLQWLIGLLLILTLVGCTETSNKGRGGDEEPAMSDDEAAVQVVKDFITASKDGDVEQIINLMEPDENLDTKGMYMELQTATSMMEQVDTENEEYTLQENNGKKAEVLYKASVSFAVKGGPQLQQEVESLFTVVKQDGEWYIRTMRPITEELPL